jgi:hypothetical protein
MESPIETRQLASWSKRNLLSMWDTAERSPSWFAGHKLFGDGEAMRNEAISSKFEFCVDVSSPNPAPPAMALIARPKNEVSASAR